MIPIFYQENGSIPMISLGILNKTYNYLISWFFTQLHLVHLICQGPEARGGRSPETPPLASSKKAGFWTSPSSWVFLGEGGTIGGEGGPLQESTVRILISNDSPPLRGALGGSNRGPGHIKSNNGEQHIKTLLYTLLMRIRTVDSWRDLGRNILLTNSGKIMHERNAHNWPLDLAF